MKTLNHTLSGILLSAIASVLICSCGRDMSRNELKRAFEKIPDSVRTSIYWHWISGNITKEGVVADLESMKEEGINRVFIANIGLSPAEAPTGPVRIFTEEWWEILHAALKRAAELDIEIGIFNCPGWSQAGGPWVRPEQSMRRIASSSVSVGGGQKIALDLPTGYEDFQDVRVLAYPSFKGSAVTLTENATVSGDGTFSFYSDDGITLRSIICRTSCHPIVCRGILSVKEEGVYRQVTEFLIDRRNPMFIVGFDPYAPVAISVPDVRGNDFKVDILGMNPGAAVMSMSVSEKPVVGSYAEKTMAKMYHSPLPYWKEYQWPVSPEPRNGEFTVKKSSVIDISGCLEDGRIEWDAPEGNWTIVRYGMVPTYTINNPALADGTGLEVDKMSKEHLRDHFDAFIGEIYRRIPAEDRRTWKVVVADSYEVGGQNFTDDFMESFEKRYGYNALPFLPVYDGVVVESVDASDRFLWDMRRFVADRLSYDHIGAMTAMSHEYGMTTWLENYGHWGFMGEFLQYGGQADEVAGEFWSEGELGDVENRAASSCAHIYGKQKVYSESFTCGGCAYSRYPQLMKQRGDRFFSEGVNSTLLHVYISQDNDTPGPGMNAPYGNEFNRYNTWYPYLDLFTDYLKRCNLMLQQGLYVADVCYFIGEDTPKMTGITDPTLPSGYQFDYINAEVIMRDMKVRNGRLVLPHGTSYGIMVLPPLQTMRPELLEKIRELVRDGAVILGPRPLRSPSYENWPDADIRVKSMADELWGDADGASVKSNDFGKGKILCGMDMSEALAVVGCTPDFVVPDGTPVVYCHRHTSVMDIYFIANQSSERQTFTAGFREDGRIPELWNPVDGHVRKLRRYTCGNGMTSVALELEPLESVFIVFADKAPLYSCSSNHDTSGDFPKHEVLATLSGTWTLTFDKDMGGPEEPVVTDCLFDWSTSEDWNVRYYSGTVNYTTEIEITDEIPEKRIYLNLNDVSVMAKVRINGAVAGGVWTTPWKVDITGMLVPGLNRIEVDVVNTWVNRLIGESFLQAEEKTAWTPNNPWNQESELQKSGLIGPVTLEMTDI